MSIVYKCSLVNTAKLSGNLSTFSSSWYTESMLIIQKKSAFWNYLSETQKDLIEEGDYLIEEIVKDKKLYFKDYSFLVFPFAKAYEGFLKQLFLDAHFISHLDYISDHFRLGKLLSPHLIERLGDRSLYKKIVEGGNNMLAEEIWHMWKIGRNETLHYYPHNIKRLTLEDAESIRSNFLNTMEHAYNGLYH